METLMKKTKEIVDLIESQSIALGLARIVSFPIEKIEKVADSLVAVGNYDQAFKVEVYAKRKADKLTFQDAVLYEVI